MKVVLLAILAFISFTPVGYGQDMPLFIAVYDLNGDGNPDLVTIPYNSRPISIAAHDLDGDGNPDLVTANSPALPGGFPTITVFLGNGDGTFRPRLVEFPLDLDPLDAAEPQRIIVSDFNGDGVDDLAVTENAGAIGRVAILLGIGGGDFELPLTFSVGSGAQALTAADLNGDGPMDLAVVNQGSSSISVLLGLGDGTFERLSSDLNTGPCFPEGQPLDCRPNAIIAGDFDRDGQLDLAAASGGGNTISIFRGMGDGRFDAGAKYEFSPGAEPVDLIAFDPNYDGVLDLAAVNRFFPAVSVLIGNGDGTFQPGMGFPSGGSAIAIGDGDLSWAGMQDVLAGLNPSILSVLLGDPGSLLGGFTQLGGFPDGDAVRPAVVGDFNHDGGLDIARADVAGITVLLDPFVHPADFVDGGGREGDLSDPDKRDQHPFGRPLAPKAKGGGGGPQPSFHQCSPTGYDCNILITLDRKRFLQVEGNPNMSLYPTPVGLFDIGSLIGFQNDSREPVHSLHIKATGIYVEASWICMGASSLYSPLAPNVRIVNIFSTRNFAVPPWYFVNGCAGSGECVPNSKCDVVFDGGVQAGQSTYFNLHNLAPNYTGYFEVTMDQVVPWLSFQDVVVEGETADAVLTLFPSDPPADVTLTLTTTAGTGSALFTDTNSTTESINGLSGGSVEIPIEGVQASSASANIRLKASVSGVTRELNFTVAGVGFKPDGNCSGFDDTLTPAWIMAPASGSNTAVAEIDPAAVANRVGFVSADTATATVSPATAGASPQTVTVSGVAKGETEVQAKSSGSSDACDACPALNVAVKDRINRTIAIHAITEENDDEQLIPPGTTGLGSTDAVTGPGPNGFRDTVPATGDVVSQDGLYVLAGTDGIADTTANGSNLEPLDVPTAAALQTYLNDSIWGRQANVYFTVTRSDHTLNFDLDRDGKLDDPYRNPSGAPKAPEEWDEIEVVRTVHDTTVDYNIYYVSSYERPVAVTVSASDETFTQGTSPGAGSVEYTTAHEVGHLLGISGESTHVLDVMYYLSLPSNPCRVLRSDWNAVNP